MGTGARTDDSVSVRVETDRALAAHIFSIVSLFHGIRIHLLLDAGSVKVRGQQVRVIQGLLHLLAPLDRANLSMSISLSQRIDQSEAKDRKCLNQGDITICCLLWDLSYLSKELSIRAGVRDGPTTRAASLIRASNALMPATWVHGAVRFCSPC